MWVRGNVNGAAGTIVPDCTRQFFWSAGICHLHTHGCTWSCAALGAFRPAVALLTVQRMMLAMPGTVGEVGVLGGFPKPWAARTNAQMPTGQK
jgi:hypothetical protein